MEDKEFVKDVCCEYCKKFDTKDCPISSASLWSRWDYCNHFRDKDNRTIPEIIKEQK